MNDRATIIEGGCYHLSGRGGGDPNLDRKYIILAIILQITAIIVAAVRLHWK